MEWIILHNAYSTVFWRIDRLGFKYHATHYNSFMETQMQRTGGEPNIVGSDKNSWLTIKVCGECSFGSECYT